jgi:hypothetical protein
MVQDVWLLEKDLYGGIKTTSFLLHNENQNKSLAAFDE